MFWCLILLDRVSYRVQAGLELILLARTLLSTGEGSQDWVLTMQVLPLLNHITHRANSSTVPIPRAKGGDAYTAITHNPNAHPWFKGGFGSAWPAYSCDRVVT